MDNSQRSRKFMFGVATASYQIEGAVQEDGRVPSMWDVFSHAPGNIVEGGTGDVATDSYHRWHEDVALLQDLGVDAYRFSIAMPRIVTSLDGHINQPGLDHYSRMVDALLDAGIRPVVTLYHWDLPQYLADEGGWLNRETAYRLADYTEVVVNSLGDRVDSWITLNEPWCSSYLSYGGGNMLLDWEGDRWRSLPSIISILRMGSWCRQYVGNRQYHTHPLP